MPDKEIYELDIEIDDSDINQTENKLRSLDKLLQQTQRRAALLGKTRIKPGISLDDRFTSAASKINDTLTRLGRTTVSPVVGLVDNVSAAAGRIRANLLALSRTPLRVSVAGVNWDEALTGTFEEWMSSQGQNTMKRISSIVRSSLGGGFREAAASAPGLTGNTKAGGRMTAGSLSTGFPKNLQMPGFTNDGGYYPISRFLGDIAGTRKPDKASNFLLGKPLNSTIGGGASMGIRSSSGNQPAFQNIWSGIQDFQENVRDEYFKNGVKDILNKKIPELGNGLKEKWQMKLPDIRSSLEPVMGSRNMQRITEWVGPGRNLLKNVTSSVGKASKFLKYGYGEFIFDAVDIASAKPGRDRTKAITSAIIGGGLNLLGISGGPLGMAALGAAGNVAGDYLGGFIFDMFHGKNKQKPPIYSDRVMAPSVQGMTRPERTIPRVMGTPIPDNVQLPDEAINRLSVNNVKANTPQTKPVNISVSKGALNLTVNKDEINYEELAQKAGWKIASEVRFAMQNLK